jgi:hypothetical protein
MAMGVQRPDEPPDPLEVSNAMTESFLGFMGRKDARNFLRQLAADLAAPQDDRVVSIRSAKQRVTMSPSTRAWLSERLPSWLARYG